MKSVNQNEKKRRKVFAKTFEKKAPDVIVNIVNSKGEIIKTIKNGKYEKNS